MFESRDSGWRYIPYIYKLGPWLRVLLPFPSARIRVYRIKKTRSCVKRGNGFCLANHETVKAIGIVSTTPPSESSSASVLWRRRRRRRRNILKLYGIPADPRMKYQLISILLSYLKFIIYQIFHSRCVHSLVRFYFFSYFLEKN